MSDDVDGGKNAFVGFLYQMVGACGLRAWADCTDDALGALNDAGSADLQGLLGFLSDEGVIEEEGEGKAKWVGEAVVKHEEFDQDAVIHVNRTRMLQDLGLEHDIKCILVQYKVSDATPLVEIKPSHLKAIISRLHAAADRATQQGHQVTGYVLVTNRPLSRDAQRLINSPPQQRIYPPITDEFEKTLLQNLHVFTKLEPMIWREGLSKFARGYGVEETEIERGIINLVGDLASKAARGMSPLINRDYLAQAFTDFKDTVPRKLVSRFTKLQSRKQLDHLKVILGLPDLPVRRDILDQISRFATERAIIVLTGLGGSGKTVTLWHWLDEEIGTSHAQNGKSATMLQPQGVKPQGITPVICEWANAPYGHAWRSEEPERALARLKRANPEQPDPILYMGVDGVDERADEFGRHEALQKLLKWFWEEDQRCAQEQRPPSAILLLTSRDMNQIHERWLGIDTSFGIPGRPVVYIPVGMFSAVELKEAAQLAVVQKRLSQGLCNRLQQSLDPNSEESQPLENAYQAQPYGDDALSVLPVAERVLKALKHPVMWRVFLQLNNENQELVFDGDPQALQRLAQLFAKWFCIKARLRGSMVQVNDLREILRSIAIWSYGLDQGYPTQNDWANAACTDGQVDRHTARQLYEEALSAGIIQQTDRSHWFWSHGFVTEYLAQGASFNGGTEHDR